MIASATPQPIRRNPSRRARGFSLASLAVLASLAAGCSVDTASDATPPAPATRGKADSTGTVRSCQTDDSYDARFCGGRCPPSFSELVRYVGGHICAGSAADPASLAGNCGVAAWDLQSGARAAVNGDHRVYAASTIKLVMLAAALHYGTASSRLRAHASAIFSRSDNALPARVLDELASTLRAGGLSGRAADYVNRFMHDVVGMSARSQFTRWCPAGETCHVATSCGAGVNCRDVMPFTTANDALELMAYLSRHRSSPLWGWSAARDQQLGLFGVRSCGLQRVTVHHKVGSLWFDDDGLTYNDIAAIEIPGRAPLLVVFLDGLHANQGQQGRAAFAMFRLLRDGVLDFSGVMPAAGNGGSGGSDPGGEPSEPSEPSTPSTPSTPPSDLPDARATCATVHDVSTCSRRYADVLLECNASAGRFRWVRCPGRCASGGWMKPDRCE